MALQLILIGNTGNEVISGTKEVIQSRLNKMEDDELTSWNFILYDDGKLVKLQPEGRFYLDFARVMTYLMRQEGFSG